MKILLIHPQNYLQRCSTGIYGRHLRYAPLTMPTLKALIPKDIDAHVRIIDEMVEPVDLDYSADLVGITAITGTATRAYEFADRFRTRGATVVMGGIHATLMSAEALEHADVVVKGPAERSWPQLLRDLQTGNLQRVYHDRKPLSPEIIVAPDRSSIHKKDYVGHASVEMSRGCSNQCEFCTSHRFYSQYVTRPIQSVLDEIEQLKSKVVFFLDPNLIGDREYAKEFFREFTKYRKWWLGCASMDLMEDEELLNMLAKSGCKGLLIGFESINPQALTQARKIQNHGKRYKEVVRRLHDKGILVQGCFVFGFDCDEPSVFEETADFIAESGIDLPQFTVYTPFSGTPVFDRLEKEGRILTHDWSRYNGQNVVFQPQNMSVRELEEGMELVRNRCYSFIQLAKRLTTRPYWLKPLVISSYLNFRRYQKKIQEKQFEPRRTRSYAKESSVVRWGSFLPSLQLSVTKLYHMEPEEELL
ncbi:MAG: radical SAM protein [bacterium]|nr:radical SAM protein [bacterium]